MNKPPDFQKRSSSAGRKQLFLLLILALLTACAHPVPAHVPALTVRPISTATALQTLTPSLQPTATPVPSPTTTSTVKPLPTVTSTGQSCCSINPVTTSILRETSADGWLEWVKKLSGAEPVVVGGQQVTFDTRYTPAMFDSPGPTAFDFVLETIQGWYPKEQIEVQPYADTGPNQRSIQGKNLILTLPGTTAREEIVILSAHLDSISRISPEKTAPGAEDNASGSAALLEAARLFRDHQFERTIRIIWFTGEEEGLLGSQAYVKVQNHLREIQGVVNLDMFGYDADNDGCFELHVGKLPQSGRVGQCFVDSIAAYQLNLPHFDYLIDDATSSSDHGSFWKAGVGAVEVLENYFPQGSPGGCQTADRNSSYHTPQDTYDRLNPDSAIRIVQAGLATVTALAGPLH